MGHTLHMKIGQYAILCRIATFWKTNGDKHIHGIFREQGSNMTRLHELWESTVISKGSSMMISWKDKRLMSEKWV